jgi:hypothetical protein
LAGCAFIHSSASGNFGAICIGTCKYTALASWQAAVHPFTAVRVENLGVALFISPETPLINH